MTVSIKDVASLANVSSATVSRVLSNKPHISAEKRQCVLQAAKTLGYQPSHIARSLRVQSSQIIGLIITDIQNPFFTGLVRAVEDQAYENQYGVLLCNSDENPDKESLYVDLMVAEKVAGVIIVPTSESAGPINKLFNAKIPLVVVDRQIRDLDLDTVIINNYKAAYDGISNLIENGHKRIGAILPTKEVTTGSERYRGYVGALNHQGISEDPTLIRSGIPKEAIGYQFANELMDLSDPPTALFTGNNLLTVGTIHAIMDRGMSIPEDISIIAFDDMDWYTIINPKLTAIAQPIYKMGWTATDLILKRINDIDKPVERITYKTDLKIRNSVKNIIDSGQKKNQ
ncbi:MAG: LacI family DNA-binding transcriptional regulator [Flexilinea sp.]